MSFSGGAPGFSLKRVYAACNDSDVAILLGTELWSLLQASLKERPNPDTLGELCSRLIDPKAVLKNVQARNVLLQYLPEEKKQELLSRLSHIEPTLRDQSLQAINFQLSKKLYEELLNFFGVEDEERASALTETEIEPCAAGYGLFAHQRDIAFRAEQMLSEYPRTVLLHMPTGAGKTRTAMNIVARHLANNGQTLVCWLAQSSELLEQAASEFRRTWQHYGNRELPIFRFWGSYNPSLEDARDGVLIAGFAKLYALYQRDANMLMRLGDRASLIVVDEAHQSIARTYQSLIQSLHSKRPINRLLGLSATPGRTWNNVAADAELAKFFNERKVGLQIPDHPDPVSYLLKEGYLAKPTFRLIESSITEVPEQTEGEEYSDETLNQLSLSTIRNQMILDEAESLLGRHKRVVLFAASVLHAKVMAAILVARGHEADVVTGETEPGLRERIIRKFKSADNRRKIICNFGVLTTGFDAPQTSAALIARPTRSLVLYSQMVGRVIRGPKQGGNESAEVVTVVDPALPGFGDIAEAFLNWEDVWVPE